MKSSIAANGAPAYKFKIHDAERLRNVHTGELVWAPISACPACGRPMHVVRDIDVPEASITHRIGGGGKECGSRSVEEGVRLLTVLRDYY